MFIMLIIQINNTELYFVCCSMTRVRVKPEKISMLLVLILLVPSIFSINEDFQLHFMCCHGENNLMVVPFVKFTHSVSQHYFLAYLAYKILLESSDTLMNDTLQPIPVPVNVIVSGMFSIK